MKLLFYFCVFCLACLTWEGEHLGRVFGVMGHKKALLSKGQNSPCRFGF